MEKILFSGLMLFCLVTSSCKETEYGEIYKDGYCNSSDQNYIEDRDSQYDYLRNTSRDKRIKFIVEVSSFTTEGEIDGKTKVYNKKFVLDPGEKKNLGCAKEYNIQRGISDRSRWFKREYHIMGTLVEN